MNLKIELNSIPATAVGRMAGGSSKPPRETSLLLHGCGDGGGDDLMGVEITWKISRRGSILTRSLMAIIRIKMDYTSSVVVIWIIKVILIISNMIN